ncbi:hypothetical protein MADE_000001020815 [Alteromonas mediterranea DE]|uniref:Uncharacterized protein n=1 Tax=Alteromonas mediterranea (strain DSM 17117 / CIP 110805 / LMG 28347 / Deep ecotype) TaxID=1774373 RepID=T2DM76_ALTMD|nr:hypothetical protein MADE_000001020815 [Alteromonas mediterranea DE]
MTGDSNSKRCLFNALNLEHSSVDTGVRTKSITNVAIRTGVAISKGVSNLRK